MFITCSYFTAQFPDRSYHSLALALHTPYSPDRCLARIYLVFHTHNSSSNTSSPIGCIVGPNQAQRLLRAKIAPLFFFLFIFLVVWVKIYTLDKLVLSIWRTFVYAQEYDTVH